MADIPEKRKRTLKDVSHLFLSSLEEEKDTAKNPTTPHQFETYHINPAVKILSLMPIGCTDLSLLMHVYLAKLLFHSPYKIYIITSEPHSDSWLYLEHEFHLPSFVDIDFSKDMRTFLLHENTALVAVSQQMVGDLLTFKSAVAPTGRVLDPEERPLLLFFDASRSDMYWREKVARLIDSFVIMTAPRIEDLRSAYKLIKMYRTVNPLLTFKIIICGRESPRLQSFLADEFNAITGNFLGISVDFIGYCDTTPLTDGTFLQWRLQEERNIFTIDTHFIEELRHDKWSEELLSLYQTILSAVQL